MTIQPGTSPLFAHLDAERVQTYSLVLASTGIPHSLEKGDSSWRIFVGDERRSDARNAIAAYLLENPVEHKRRPVAPLPKGRTFSGVFAALIPAAVHAAIGSGAQVRAYAAVFGADAEKIMQGELYRCVTALLLHGDAAHLVANMAGALLFGTYAAILYGWGIGWLMIVISGASGNFLTAWWYGRSHLSIGASTAVFAALGLCAAAAFRHRRGHRRSWLVLAGALALVGWLGTSPRADLIAHLLGFGAGLGFGHLYATFIGRTMTWGYQAAAVVILALVVSGSWLWGLSYSG